MSRSLPILLVTFDLDDTLWDIWPTIARAEQLLHDWLTQHYPNITARYDIDGLKDLRLEIREQRPQVGVDLTALRIEGLRLAARRSGYRSEFDGQRAFDVFYRARNDVQFFSDALPVLEALSQHYTLGALSNGNADINRVGIGHFFDFAFSASDVDRPKPASDMFRRAWQLVNSPDPQQIVHVGDDPLTDIGGAAQLGWRTVWVNRGTESWQQVLGDEAATFEPDAEISSLAALPSLLAQWQA